MSLKAIHFEQMNRLSFIRLSLIAFAVACFILSHTLFEDSPYENIRILGFIIPIMYLGRRFWFKNYIRWNKNMIILKFHYFSDHSLKFTDIYSLQRLENQLKIKLSSGKVYSFNIENIRPKDISKLNKIIIKYSNAGFYDYRENAYYEGECCSNT